MKISKIIYIVLTVVVIIVGVSIIRRNLNSKINNVTIPTALTSPSPSPSPSPKVSLKSPKPSPGIIFREVKNYQYWAGLLEPLNRRLTLSEDCTFIVPSQVAYPNNTQIMLDNTYSNLPRVLKIGTKEYSLAANDWLLTTLSSKELPAKLTIFCGNMELGQLDLVAN